MSDAKSRLQAFAAQSGVVGKGFSPDFKQLAADQHDEALELLAIDTAGQPTWFSPLLTHEVGVFLEGDFVVIAARPGGGKTTLLTAQVDHLLRNGHRVIYAGMEMKPSRLKMQIAAARLGFDVAHVVRGHWHRLAEGARSKLEQEVLRFKTEWAEQLVFVPDERVSLTKLEDWGKVARQHGFGFVMVDHLHRMDWGNPNDLTATMTEGVKRMKTMAKVQGVRLMAAAQLKRSSAYDPLEDYMVPPLSAIKQCGAIEEEADTVVMVHRALRHDATEGDLMLVRRGQRKVAEVADVGTMALHVAKCRLDGEARDQEIRMYVGRGRVFDTPQQRDDFTFKVGR